MATVLSKENLASARSAIIKYRTDCDGIYSKLQAEINGLTASDFLGEASLGFVDFFGQITPALTTQLTGTEESVTSMMENLITLVEQLLEPVDPQLGSANKNAANGGGANNG